MNNLKSLDWAALVLAVIGALNWGLVGLFSGFDLVDYLFGGMPSLLKLVYILVGLSGLYLILVLGKLARK